MFSVFWWLTCWEQPEWKISRLDDAQESAWMSTGVERSGEIWLVHWASQFKLNIATFVSVLFELFNRLLSSPPHLIPTSSELESLFPFRPLPVASVLGSLCSSFSPCLPLCASLLHSLCSYVSVSLPSHPTSSMNRLSLVLRLGEGDGFQYGQKQRFLLVLLLTFSDSGELHVILPFLFLTLLVSFPFNLQVLGTQWNIQIL